MVTGCVVTDSVDVVRFVRGWGRITAPGEVTVTTGEEERVLRAARGIVLNPGVTLPTTAPFPG